MISVRIQKSRHQLGTLYRVFCLVRDEWTGDGSKKLTPIVVIGGHLPTLNENHSRFTLRFRESSSGNMIFYEILDIDKSDRRRKIEARRERKSAEVTPRIAGKIFESKFA